MAKTQDSSFAATVLNALNTSGEYSSGALKATNRLVDVPAGYLEDIGPVHDIDLYFQPRVISGIKLAAELDKALTNHQIAHSLAIDWDKDVIVYTREWTNFSIYNWTDNPDTEDLPIRMRFSAVTRKHYTLVLATMLDRVSEYVVGKPLRTQPKHAKSERG